MVYINSAAGANPLDEDYVDFNNLAEHTKVMVKELLRNVQL